MRIVALIALTFIGLVTPLWVFMAFAFLYALRWFALELVLVALLFDAVFLVGTVPLYSLLIVGLIFIIEWFRPTLSVY